MLINIQSRPFALSPAINNYVNSKLQAMFERYESKIININVSLFDINGPKGGEDKCCKIIVKIKGVSLIVVQETAEDLYDAINTCSRRSRRVVKRQLSMHRRTRRKIGEMLQVSDEESEMQNTAI